IQLDLREAVGPGEALTAVKEQVRAVPNGGLGYGLLRYLSSNEAVVASLRALPPPAIRFRYLGSLDGLVPSPDLFAPAPEATGPTQCRRGVRDYLLEVTASLWGKRLQVEWTYSANLHERTTVENLARHFLERLRALLAHCQSVEAGGYTASDFPEARINQADLANLLAQIRPVGEGDVP